MNDGTKATMTTCSTASPSPIMVVREGDEPTFLTLTTQPSNRCRCCRKKLALTDFACGKCSVRHCAAHRLPEQHECGHDFKAEGQERLTKQLVKVVGAKIDKI